MNSDKINESKTLTIKDEKGNDVISITGSNNSNQAKIEVFQVERGNIKSKIILSIDASTLNDIIDAFSDISKLQYSQN